MATAKDLLKRTKTFQSCFLSETIRNANILETRDVLAWNSGRLPKRDVFKNNCNSLLPLPARGSLKNASKGSKPESELKILFLQRVDIKLQTLLELQPILNLSSNLFAADHNSLKHFLQIHHFLDNPYTIKNRSLIKLQKDVYLDINYNIACKSKYLKITQISTE